MVLTARAETIVCFARRVLKAHEDMLQEFNRQGATQEIRFCSPDEYFV